MNRTVVVLVGTQLLDAIGLGLLLPILPFFIQEFGASAIEVTLLVAIYALAGVVFTPVFGWLGDRINRKLLLLGSVAGVVLSYWGMMGAHSLAELFLWRALGGAAAAKGGIVNAWLIDVVDKTERSRFIGLLGSMNGFGMLLGPIIGGSLMAVQIGNTASYQNVFLGGMSLGVIIFLAILLYLESPDRVQKSELEETDLGLKELISHHSDLFLLNSCLFLAFSVVFSASAIYVQSQFDWGPTEAGIVIGAMTGFVAIARALLAHRILEHLGVLSGTLVSIVIMAISLIICAAFDTPWVFVPFYCLSAGSYAIAAIGITLLLAERLSVNNRASGLSLLVASSSLAIAIGAATNGYLFTYLTPSSPFILHGVLLLLATLIWCQWSHSMKLIETNKVASTGVGTHGQT